MAPIARNHHYLPQSYLAQFTETGSNEGHFFVHDVSNGKVFRTSPRNVAAQRDFNRMDIEGESPDCVERILAPFEALASDSIKKINITQSFPSENDFSHIMNLLCLLAVRNPKHRRKFNLFRADVAQQILNLLVSDKRHFDSIVKTAQEAGHLQECDVSFSEMKSFIEEKRYEFKFSSAGNVRREMDAFDNLLPYLGQRSWSVTISHSEGPFFICSDDPVTLTFKEGISARPGMPMGFDMNHTEVFLPLSPNIGFYGVHEDPLPPVTMATPENVARRNSYIVFNADRQIYSTEKEFMVLRKGKIQSFNRDLETQRRQKQV